MNYYDRKELSNSDLSWLKNQLSGKVQSDPTEAYKFGRLIDCMITEPDQVDYFKLTCGSDNYEKKDFEIAQKMKEAFFKDPLCAELVKYSSYQVIMAKNIDFNYQSVNFTIPCRCKWDLWFNNLGSGGDIKSTTATTQSQFEAAVKYFDYDRQRAFYMRIAGSKQDILIGISKKNYKIFKVPIKVNDNLHKSGTEKYNYLAFEWFKMFGNKR